MGGIKILTERIGEENINNQGLKMRIKEYHNASDVDVEFEDDFISYKKHYTAFKKGQINNNNFQKLTSSPIKKERIGEINYNKNNERMVIFEYNNKRNILVRFDNGYEVKTRYDIFKGGSIKNPFTPNSEGVGFIGLGRYKSSIKGKDTIQYKRWRNMLTRSYNEEYHKKYPTYTGCSVCTKWHDFQNFAQWFDDNYYEIDNETMCLDKDILHKGNKIYSPDTCIFVPERINILFIKNETRRGEYPIGVNYDISKNKYISQCCMNNKDRKIGAFDDPKEAFNAYKQEKEKYIKQVANEYKDRIPEKLYDAMMNYIVEITD